MPWLRKIFVKNIRKLYQLFRFQRTFQSVLRQMASQTGLINKFTIAKGAFKRSVLFLAFRHFFHFRLTIRFGDRIVFQQRCDQPVIFFDLFQNVAIVEWIVFVQFALMEFEIVGGEQFFAAFAFDLKGAGRFFCCKFYGKNIF